MARRRRLGFGHNRRRHRTPQPGNLAPQQGGFAIPREQNSTPAPMSLATIDSAVSAAAVIANTRIIGGADHDRIARPLALKVTL